MNLSLNGIDQIQETHDWQELYGEAPELKVPELTTRPSILNTDSNSNNTLNSLNFDFSPYYIKHSSHSTIFKKIKKEIQSQILPEFKSKISKLIQNRVDSIQMINRFASTYPISSRNTNFELEKQMSFRCAVDPWIKTRFFRDSNKLKLKPELLQTNKTSFNDASFLQKNSMIISLAQMKTVLKKYFESGEGYLEVYTQFFANTLNFSVYSELIDRFSKVYATGKIKRKLSLAVNAFERTKIIENALKDVFLIDICQY